jgi:hypothetical protein
MVALTVSEFEEKMAEIERIQDRVSNILYSKNWFIRTFQFKKAVRLHDISEIMVMELFSSEIIEDQ